MIKDKIKSLLADILQKEGLKEVNFTVEHPVDESHGDYASNAAMAAFSNSKLPTSSRSAGLQGASKTQKLGSPLELAQEIIDKFIIHNSKFMIHFDRVEAVKPGFINFWISKNYLISNLEKISGENKYGSKPQDLSKKVVVEYSSPNIAKPFTVGHLRSTIIGDAIANLLEANGWKVFRDNHLGDWGTQFGKQIYAIKNWGDEEKIEKSQNPVKELVALYVKFHEEAEKNPELEEQGREWFRKLEEGDSGTRRLWKKCVDWSLKEFEKIYHGLGVKFTENGGLGYSESFFEDKIQSVIKELREKKLLKESEGAELVFFPNDKFPPLMILKKDGTTLYATRDLATDKFRLKKYGRDVVIINEVGAEQALYFRQLFEVEKMLGWVKDGQRIHIKHGHYRFKDEKMSTRKGNTIWLTDVLEETIKRAEKLGSEGEEVAQAVGIGALKWNDLKRSSNLDIIFDWDEILNMQGDSGPYIQYAFARTQSVLAKLKTQNSKLKTTRLQLPSQSDGGQAVQNSKLENEEISLLRSLSRFPEVAENAAEKFAPNLLCNYLFDLAQKFNLFYQKHKILGEIGEIRDFRVLLTAAVGQTLKNGLHLLGIFAPEKM